jgi:hypothetical protein
MITPTTASYHQLLEALEDRLFVEQGPDDFEYLVDLVNEVYLKTLETHVATLNGCLNYGYAPEVEPRAKRRYGSPRRST